jgi:hypothetical protein
MLAARGQTKRLRRPGAQLEHPFGQPLRVNQFARVGGTRYPFDIRVAGILLVEPAQRRFESARVPGLEFLSRNDSI